MSAEICEQIQKRYDDAKSHRDNFVPVFEECYEYAIPQRESFYAETPGQRRDDKIFDETAVVGVQEFASRLQHGIVPNYSRWSDLKAGGEIPPEDKMAIEADLDDVTEYIFEVIQNSNFAQEVHESFFDLAVGTGTLLVEEGDALNPIRFSAVPLPHVVLESGPDDLVTGIFRERRPMSLSAAKRLYPDAVFKPRRNDTKLKLLELVERDWSRRNEVVWKYYVVDMDEKEIVHEDEWSGIGSGPYIVFRWSKAAGETYGRGPLFNALAAVKTCNLTVELILENAQMAITGIYQAEDDGVINPDTISLVSGTIIPRAPGSRGIEPIPIAGNFDVSQLILNDMRLNIKRALFNDMLGDPNKTPATATEVAERMADLSRRMGAAFGRLQTELVQPVIQRVVYILKKQGRIELPVVNGREVKVVSTSPLAQAQRNEDIASVSRFLELVGNAFGPDLINILVNSEETAVYIAQKFGVPERLLRDEEERTKLLELIQQQMSQQQGMPPDGQQPQQGPVA